MTEFKNKKILVLGLSKSGISAAKHLAKVGADVYLTESREAKDEDKKEVLRLEKLGIHCEIGGHSDEFLKDIDMVVTSPGVPPHSEIFTKLKEKNVPIISEIEVAYRESKTPFIAITGTNGKTTTTALTDCIFKTAYKSEACGNYGLPPCDLIDKNLDYYICECSSFQLETSPLFTPLISVWTNFTPDHIDWHDGLDNYFKAKARIFKSPQMPEYSVLNATDAKLREFGKTCGGNIFWFGENFTDNCCYTQDSTIFFKQNGQIKKLISLNECPMIGEHNYQNIECAVICAELCGISDEKINNAIREFKVPEHRLEKVAKIGKTVFYNDSKATNPEASLVAIRSFKPEQNVVLIAGGRDKNTDLKEFCDAINENINSVILIGEATDRFEKNLKRNGFLNIKRCNSLEQAIDTGYDLEPDVVLLSPACASFDMFSGYEERGRVFKEYVKTKLF